MNCGWMGFRIVFESLQAGRFCELNTYRMQGSLSFLCLFLFLMDTCLFCFLVFFANFWSKPGGSREEPGRNQRSPVVCRLRGATLDRRGRSKPTWHSLLKAGGPGQRWLFLKGFSQAGSILLLGAGSGSLLGQGLLCQTHPDLSQLARGSCFILGFLLKIWISPETK